MNLVLIRFLTLMAVLLALVACSSDSPEAVPANEASSRSASESSPETVETELVGEWRRLTTCQQRVDALAKFGLSRFAAEHAAGGGWLPGVTSAAEVDPLKPCAGAVPLEHGHFFTEDGAFGSRDDRGAQVDDGTYELIDDNTIVIDKEFGHAFFEFRIHGDHLYLKPDLPACAKNGCFAAQWAIAVAYPGLAWGRIN